MANFKTKQTGTVSGTGTVASADFRHLANGACGVQVVGALTGTLLIEASMDGTNFGTYAFVDCATGSTATSITAAGQYRTELVGVQSVRVRCSAYTSGTPAVTLVIQSN